MLYQLSYTPLLKAERVGFEPTRVVNSEQFSRLWPPPIGLPFLLQANSLLVAAVPYTCIGNQTTSVWKHYEIRTFSVFMSQ